MMVMMLMMMMRCLSWLRFRAKPRHLPQIYIYIHIYWRCWIREERNNIDPNYIYIYNVAPPVISWFRFAPITKVILRTMFTIVKLELCEPQLSYRKRGPHIVYMDHPKRPRREQIAQLTAVNLSIHLKLQPQSTASKERQGNSCDWNKEWEMGVWNHHHSVRSMWILVKGRIAQQKEWFFSGRTPTRFFSQLALW